MLKYNFDTIPALILLITSSLLLISEIHGHGMMLDPVSRSSRWRYNRSAPVNYDDNGLFCGGFGVQWYKNNGKCGLCGDDFSASRPRLNELGGMYGEGVITKGYSQSQNVRLGIKITTNHLGFFYFNICNLDKFKQESEECFNANKIKFSDGNFKMYIGKQAGMIYPTIVLPKGLICKHCVLRWNYQAGNNWGPCGNGTYALGCGPQENFKGCSDIRILNKFSKSKTIKAKAYKPGKLLKIFLNENKYYDDYLEPREETHMNQPLDDYFYESFENNNNVDDILVETENRDNISPSLFDKEENNAIDNSLYDEFNNQGEERILDDFDEDQFYKAKEEVFDRELINNKEEVDFSDNYAEIPKTIPEILKVDESHKEIDSDENEFNGLFEFDKEELENNALDDDSENFLYDL